MSVFSHFESSRGCGRSDETGLAKFGITPRQKKMPLVLSEENEIQCKDSHRSWFAR